MGILQRKGRKGEDVAVAALKRQGYKILERNWRTRAGEVDVVARDRDTVVFIEVKARTSGSFGNPKEAVHAEKRRKLSMAALEYLKRTGQTGCRARFDVVAVYGTDGEGRVEIVKNAFELAYG